MGTSAHRLQTGLLASANYLLLMHYSWDSGPLVAYRPRTLKLGLCCARTQQPQ